ncbi:MAG: hypothetical protein ABI042_01840 [Verrucomicrobiota bacterium]
MGRGKRVQGCPIPKIFAYQQNPVAGKQKGFARKPRDFASPQKSFAYQQNASARKREHFANLQIFFAPKRKAFACL